MHSQYLALLLRINFLHEALLPKIQVKAETGKGKLRTGLAGEGLTEMVFPAKQACSQNGLIMGRVSHCLRIASTGFGRHPLVLGRVSRHRSSISHRSLRRSRWTCSKHRTSQVGILHGPFSRFRFPMRSNHRLCTNCPAFSKSRLVVLRHSSHH